MGSFWTVKNGTDVCLMFWYVFRAKFEFKINWRNFHENQFLNCEFSRHKWFQTHTPTISRIRHLAVLNQESIVQLSSTVGERCKIHQSHNHYYYCLICIFWLYLLFQCIYRTHMGLCIVRLCASVMYTTKVGLFVIKRLFILFANTI